eukprot:3831722-Pleurochrysis_carterae.AAC.2
MHQARNIGEVVLTKRSNAYRIYNQNMREYVQQITKGNTNTVFPIAPDPNIKSYNRHRPGTHQVITTKSLQRQQKKYYEYVD